MRAITAKAAVVIAASMVGFFSLGRSAMAHDATLDNSTEVNSCGFIVATVSQDDYVGCESYHGYEESCFEQVSSRKRRLDDGVGSFCAAKALEVEAGGCVEFRIVYHEHRGAEHEGTDGTTHDHWIGVDVDVICALTEAGEEAARKAEEKAKEEEAIAALTPKCELRIEDCWKELANKPGCYVWYEDNLGSLLNIYVDDTTVTWSGQCSSGVAIGRGEQIWKSAYELVYSDMTRKTEVEAVGTGELRDGKEHGQWKWISVDNSTTEYPDGDWLQTSETLRGTNVDGMPHGQWTESVTDIFPHTTQMNCFLYEMSYGEEVSSENVPDSEC